jgi:hypothetical protein
MPKLVKRKTRLLIRRKFSLCAHRRILERAIGARRGKQTEEGDNLLVRDGVQKHCRFSTVALIEGSFRMKTTGDTTSISVETGLA